MDRSQDPYSHKYNPVALAIVKALDTHFNCHDFAVSMDATEIIIFVRTQGVVIANNLPSPVAKFHSRFVNNPTKDCIGVVFDLVIDDKAHQQIRQRLYR